jgi:cysteine synthase A
MDIRDGFVGSVGDTPLIRLPRISEDTGCEILGKAEFMNPGGSVKDRAALGIIEAAERDGRLQPGGTVVEGTAGNTGIGLAHICNTRGYRCLIVIPETQSREKFEIQFEILETLGAEVRAVPAVPYRDPGNYQHVAGRLADELEDAIWANQFDNTANREIHERTTGPEIWAQTGGGVDAFVAATGTGGTLAGVGRALKYMSGPHTERSRSRAARSPKASAIAESPPIWRAQPSTTRCESVTRTPWPWSTGC